MNEISKRERKWNKHTFHHWHRKFYKNKHGRKGCKKFSYTTRSK